MEEHPDIFIDGIGSLEIRNGGFPPYAEFMGLPQEVFVFLVIREACFECPDGILFLSGSYVSPAEIQVEGREKNFLGGGEGYQRHSTLGRDQETIVFPK